MVGAEALVRWQHPERGLLPPEEFLEEAERTGLIVDIGQLVLDAALSSLRRWREERLHFDPFTLSLNLSALQYRQPDLVERVGAALGRRHIDPENVQLEVGAAIARETPARLEELHEIGIRVAVDDIDMSHTLERLTALGADSFKIDRSIVAGIGSGDRRGALVRSILGLADRLDLPVVAEGIERAVQRKRLRRLGCPFGPGHLLSRPLPEEAFEELLGARVIGNTDPKDAEWIVDRDPDAGPP